MIALSDLDSAFETAGQRKPVAELPQPWLPNGLFTLTFPCGTHKTIRIHTQQLGNMAGKRILSLLIGPQNTDDFEGIAELTPAGVWVWKRWKGKKPDEYAQLLWSLMKGEELEGHSVLVSKKCMRCNRPLSTPESIERGIGPECEKKG